MARNIRLLCSAALFALLAAAAQAQISCYYSDVTTSTTNWPKSTGNKFCVLAQYKVGGSRALSLSASLNWTLPVGTSWDADGDAISPDQATCERTLQTYADAYVAYVRGLKTLGSVPGDSSLTVSGACCNTADCNSASLSLKQLAQVNHATLRLPSVAIMVVLMAVSTILLSWM
eukprot:CAMPEP_0202921914 /NCGR_PEP_ID=MMETSP1392-20130828/77641_1 /ASSEMBLY_ACC=CAM_ASM_000868 /TAXON_ID=225041 /ORGANISM="Chlamydomonas chlamydogama, Strain SAG 11-48b" /LENGTH=173 /DNA_ID=CAMNT_0049615515 /DNA_START=678 /DNA_END=1199 /DNA_ORIENTATION=-